MLRSLDNEIYQETVAGKMWQVNKGGMFSSAQEAEQYAENLQLGGYDDWRLPTKNEMLKLEKIFFRKKNGDCTLDRKGDFWSVSIDLQPSVGCWREDYLCGPEFRYLESRKAKGYVRAIRP